MFFFDILYWDGIDLFEVLIIEWLVVLDVLVLVWYCVDWLIMFDLMDVVNFLDVMLVVGYEGVMVKVLVVCYFVGCCGVGWLKVKLVYIFDLVVFVVEWGLGCWCGKFFNIYLGVCDLVIGGFVMVGKIFKGMIDVMLDW